ncbi:MAG: aspartate aminotransferase family protein, partial [Aquiluna sp.]
MHSPGEDNGLREAIFQYATERLDYNPPPLDGPKTLSSLAESAGETITEVGLGGQQALKLFADT